MCVKFSMSVVQLLQKSHSQIPTGDDIKEITEGFKIHGDSHK